MNITRESEEMDKNKPKVQSLLEIITDLVNKEVNDQSLGEAVRKLIKQINKTH